jgi:leukotriene-A4 hydrolase
MNTKFFSHTIIGLLLISIVSCNNTNPKPSKTMAIDTHSYAKPTEASITHLSLDLTVDFTANKLIGSASYLFNHKGDSITLDVNGLLIKEVSRDNEIVDFSLSKTDPIKGKALTIPLLPNSKSITIQYETTADAKAVQWLTPEQTADKTHPFLFTQSQAILARTWIPIQDSPGIRFTYDAKIKVPAGLMASMSAVNDTALSPTGEYAFKMNQPIPAYLMALTVGYYKFKAISKRAGIYAEPSMLDKSVAEFSQVEEMIVAAEKLYGKYAWERYDIMVLPPSFPFGGMENPRLTFATPTIIAGDQSLVSLIAHELAHSWSGNLVTNSTWDDFWLNEGFTVYFERRIMEAIEGKSYTDMLEVLGYQDLLADITDIGETDKDTHLKLDLTNRDPDDGMTDIAYEKGYFFLRTIEEFIGREKLDAFLTNYFSTCAFQVMDTEEFLSILYKELPEVNTNKAQLQVDAWIYGPGLPSNCPTPHATRFDNVSTQLAKIEHGDLVSSLVTDNWSSHEWLYFLREVGGRVDSNYLQTLVANLDNQFHFTQSGNCEILAAWFQLTIKSNYEPAKQALTEFLTTVGRRKFLTPTYEALIEADPSKKWARDIYEKARPNYHAVATQTMDKLLN